MQSCKPAAAGAAQASPGLARAWAGTVRQNDGARLSMRVRIVATRVHGPTSPVHHGAPLGCSGRWRPLGRHGGGDRFRELITRGTSALCQGTGEVRVTLRARRTAGVPPAGRCRGHHGLLGAVAG